MKKSLLVSLLKHGLCIFLFFFIHSQSQGQVTTKTGSAIPDDVNKIFTNSCIGCHSNDGKLMAKSKLNFDQWASYTPQKQKDKAAKIYSELKKAKMPPKEARAKKPELIPNASQIALIKKWSESFTAEKK